MSRKGPAESDRYGFQLRKTPGIERVAHAIASTDMDVRRTSLRYRALHKEGLIGKPGDYSTFRGVMAEIHVRSILKDHPEVEPVMSRFASTANYGFRSKGDYANVDIIRREDRDYQTELDALVAIDGLVTVVEVKMSTQKDILREPLEPANMRTRFAPLMELVREGHVDGAIEDAFGYIYVVPPGEDGRRWSSLFRKRGGVVTPFTHSMGRLKELLAS